MQITELNIEEAALVSGGTGIRNPNSTRNGSPNARSDDDSASISGIRGALAIDLRNPDANNTRANQTNTTPSDLCIELVQSGQINTVHDC